MSAFPLSVAQKVVDSHGIRTASGSDRPKTQRVAFIFIEYGRDFRLSFGPAATTRGSDTDTSAASIIFVQGFC